MRIDLRNLSRKRLFAVTVDATRPPTVVRDAAQGETPTQEVFLNWDRAMDDEGHLRRCPVCGCRELFVRKDFPQITGFAIVALAAGVSLYLFANDQIFWAFGLMGSVVLLDLVIYLLTGRCLVCYRCRSEFRDLPISKDHPGWDLAIGEKYRQGMYQAQTNAKGSTSK